MDAVPHQPPSDSCTGELAVRAHRFDTIRRFAATVDARHGDNWVFEAPALICGLGGSVVEVGVAGGVVTSMTGVERTQPGDRLWLRSHPDIAAALRAARAERRWMTIRLERTRPARLCVTCRGTTGNVMFGWDIHTPAS